MSTDSEKKRVERWALERLQRLLPSFPTGDVAAGEEPDFTISLHDGKTLGIELTELHRHAQPGESPQAQEALRHRIVRRAQKMYDASGSPFLQAVVHFSDVQLTKSDVRVLAEKIADIVKLIIPPPNQSRDFEPDEESFGQLLDEIHHVTTYNIPNATRSFFTAPGATWVATLKEADISRAINSKENKYDRYRQRADEIWLVITCNGAFMSTWFEDTEQTQSTTFATKFDRVILLSHFENRVIEIPTHIAPSV